MGSFAKKTTRNKRNRITRRKRRSSRKKCERHRYTKRGGDKPTTMSDSLMKSFPAMTKFPSCGTCMEAIDKSSYKLKSPTKKKSISSSAKSTKTQGDSWNEWTTAEMLELGEPNKIPTNSPLNLTPLEDSPNFKPPSMSNAKSTTKKNPFRRKSISSK